MHFSEAPVHRGLVRLLRLILVCAISSPVAAEPSISSVDPPFAFSDEETRVTLRGAGFGSDSRVSLYRGGLFVAGKWPPFGGILGTDLAVDGDVLFVGTGRFDDLYVVDLSDPRRPGFLGSLTLAFSWGPLEVAEDHLFAANGLFGLHVVDARDPRALQPLVYLPSPRIRDLVWDDGVLFLAEGAAGLEVLDVGDPASPVTLAVWTGEATKVAAAAGFVYVAEPGFGIRVLDARDPGRLAEIGALPRAGTIEGLVASGGLLHVAHDTPSGLSVVDISNPAEPTPLGVWQSPLPVASLAVEGTRAYVGHHLPGGVSVLDFEDPSAPRLLGDHDTASRVGAVDVAGSLLFALDDSGNVIVFDARSPQGPDSSSVLDVGGAAIDVAWEARTAFVAVAGRGLLAVDAQDPANLRPLGQTRAFADPRRVTVQDGYAYLAAGAEGVWITDVRDPASLQIVALLSVPPFYEAVDVAVDGDRMAVAEEDRDVILVDVSDPRNPWALTRIPGRSGAVALEGDLLLDAQRLRFNRMDTRTVDVSDPVFARILGAIQLPATEALLPSAALRRPLAAVGAGRFVHTLELDDPAAPSASARWPIAEDIVHDLRLDRDRLLVANGRNGLLEFDVSDPALPLLTGRYPTPGIARGLAARDDWALVADDARGLRSIRLDPRPRDVRLLPDGSLELTVPAGLPPGPYHLSIAEGLPLGFSAGPRPTLGNGFRVCARRALSASLESVGKSSYRVVLDGDPALFDTEATRSLRLSLPTLPAELEMLSVRAAPSATDRIELSIFPREDRGTVRLVSADPQALAEVWQRAVAAGGFDVPALDERTFGNLVLAIRQPPAGEVDFSPVRFRYDLPGGVLVSARAQGHGADLSLDARAVYDETCVVGDVIEVAETLRAACGRGTGARPDRCGQPPPR